ncbi:MAG: universal stress protein [Microscillaceae bacterium]|nr:universal stress protein [Microscillaceae bacterium]
MKKILVPTDFSPFADHALQVAVAIARKAQAEITLLHILLTPDNTEIRVSAEEYFMSKNEDAPYLKSIVEVNQINLNDLIAKSGYGHIKYQIVSGDVTKAITATAAAEKSDLIVMGTQGNSEYENFFVGSNAEKVVRFAPCPVLTLRQRPKEIDFKNLVLACNLDDKDNLPIAQIQEFQAFFGAKIHLVHINTPANFTPSKDLRIKAKNFARKYSLENYEFEVYCDYIEDDGVVHFATTIHADLIVMISHKRTGIARLFSGSVSEGVVSEATTPVLTFSLKS